MPPSLPMALARARGLRRSFLGTLFVVCASSCQAHPQQDRTQQAKAAERPTALQAKIPRAERSAYLLGGALMFPPALWQVEELLLADRGGYRDVKVVDLAATEGGQSAASETAVQLYHETLVGYLEEKRGTPAELGAMLFDAYDPGAQWPHPESYGLMFPAAAVGGSAMAQTMRQAVGYLHQRYSRQRVQLMMPFGVGSMLKVQDADLFVIAPDHHWIGAFAMDPRDMRKGRTVWEDLARVLGPGSVAYVVTELPPSSDPDNDPHLRNSRDGVQAIAAATSGLNCQLLTNPAPPLPQDPLAFALPAPIDVRGEQQPILANSTYFYQLPGRAQHTDEVNKGTRDDPRMRPAPSYVSIFECVPEASAEASCNPP